MRSLASGYELNDEMLKELWVNCLTADMTPFLITSPFQDDLDKLAELADSIHNLHDRPGNNVVKTSASAGKTSQQSDVIAERLKKLEQLVSVIAVPVAANDALCLQRDPVVRCNYPWFDSGISKSNTTGPEVSVIPRSAEKCFLQPIDLTVYTTNNQFTRFYTPLPSIYTIEHQDLNTSGSLDPNCHQSSTMVNPVEEIDRELVQTETRDLSKELPDLADESRSINGDTHNLLSEYSTISTKKRNKRNEKMAKPTAENQQNICKSVTQNRRLKHKVLLWRFARRQL
nr:hypothetical protein HmN_000805800 [Hymenolepis microstoma]